MFAHHGLLNTKGSRKNNLLRWTADASRPAALRKGLHTMSMRPFARLAGRVPQRPNTATYSFASPKMASPPRGEG